MSSVFIFSAIPLYPLRQLNLAVKSRADFTVKFYYCQSIEWCILVEIVRKTEKNATFPASVGHIGQEK